MKTITKNLKLIALLALLVMYKSADSQTCTASFVYSLGANGAVTFTSTSAPVNSITTQYYWTFGNGNTYTATGGPGMIASQTYSANGVYTVSLFFLTPLTCSNQAVQTITITNATGCGLFANFAYNQGANGLVNFNNSSTGTAGGTTYSWNFGDLSTSNSPSPSHTYTSNGSYTVTMTANNNFTPTCISTKTAVVVVNSICNLVANFNYTLGNNGQVNFSSTSIGTSSITLYTWSFGNGQITSGNNMANTSITYTANGTYVVVLKDSTFVPPCVSYISQTITVSNVTNPCNLNANFTSSQAGGGLVNFNNTSTGISGGVTYTWSFGDASSSNAASPAHTYTSSGNYIVTLTANNNYSYACASTKTTAINVNFCNMTAGFTYSIAPNGLVNFYNTSTGTSSVTTYYWSFGNGQTSTLTNPSTQYTANGTYTVNLFLMSLPSCSLAATPQVITITNIGGPCNLVASFAHTVGANGLVSFQNTSTGTSSVSTYYWIFGDGTSGSGTNPNHTYASAGNYNVLLLVSNGPACADTVIQSINITGVPCIANANFTLNPTNTPQFWVAIPAFPWNVTSATWSWGDGSSSNLLYASHTYSAAGMYSICLTVTVGCGSTASACASYSVYKMSSSANIIQVNVVDPALVEVGFANYSNDFASFTLYPNPNNGLFSIELIGAGQGLTSIEVADITGRIVYEEKTNTTVQEKSKQIDLHLLPNGIYIVKVQQGNQILSKKLVIRKD